MTEEVTGVDLVQAAAQLRRAPTLAELGLGPGRSARAARHAVQVRVNMETMAADGARDARRRRADRASSCRPAPACASTRFGYAGYRTSPRFDSLLAKVDRARARATSPARSARGRRALAEFRIEGVGHEHRRSCAALLARPAVARRDDVSTPRFVEPRMPPQLVDAAALARGSALANRRRLPDGRCHRSSR